MARITDIAKACGVSPATVSNALNGKKNLSTLTKEKVLKKAEELGYKHSARAKEPDRKNPILFIFSDFNRDFYLDIIKGINDCLGQSGYDLVICTNESGVNFLKNKLSAGVISLDIKVSDENIVSMSSNKYPVVVMDRIIDDGYTKSVLVNNYNAMSNLMQKLINKGYRRFGYLGGEEKTLDNIERFQAFGDVLTKNNLRFSKVNYFHGNYQKKSGYKVAKMMLLYGTLPEILVCANDDMAVGAIQAFEDAGLTIPADIGVTGFDGTVMAEVIGLTTVVVPRYEIGYIAASELLLMLEGENNKENVLMSALPVFRRTTR